MLKNDSFDSAKSRLRSLSDPRVTDYWDRDRNVGVAFIGTLGLNRTAWDIYAVYEPGIVWEADRASSLGEGAVFQDPRGGLLYYRGIQNAFNRGFINCDLPWRSTHICRHSFGTLAHSILSAFRCSNDGVVVNFFRSTSAFHAKTIGAENRKSVRKEIRN